MSTPLARALLDWYRANVCDTDVRMAWHTVYRNGALALSACSTDEDFRIVAQAMQIAGVMIQSLPEWARSPDVEFIGNRVTLYANGKPIKSTEI